MKPKEAKSILHNHSASMGMREIAAVIRACNLTADRRDPPKEPEWLPFREAERPPIPTVYDFVRQFQCSAPEAIREIERMEQQRIYMNNLYQVNILPTSWPGVTPEGGLLHLSIKTLDRRALHDWRHLQRIKNELVGPECEAIEIFPKESRLVDTANQYHLFAFASPDITIPVGFTAREVMDTPEAAQVGSVQRPL